MSAEKSNRSVVNAFPQLCEGAGGNVPLRAKLAHASITVYNDGSREVGCGFLDVAKGTCKATTTQEISCVQLFPATQNLSLNLHPGTQELLSVKQSEQRNYTAFATTEDEKRVGIWKEKDQQHAEYLPEGYTHVIGRRSPIEMGIIDSSSPFWKDLNPPKGMDE